MNGEKRGGVLKLQKQKFSKKTTDQNNEIDGEKTIFRRVFALVAGIFIFQVFLYFFKYSNLSAGLTGFSVADTVMNLYSTMPVSSKLFILLEWLALVLLLIFVFFKERGVLKKKKQIIDINLKSRYNGLKTDLDVLYDILKEKKQLTISNIAKIFKVKKEIAMNWCKTLELNNLAVIHYPRMGEPEVRAV